jgi:hypothetical protein
MWKIVVAIVFGILFIGSTLFLNNRNRKRNFSYYFNGKVQSVRYDLKGFPYVTIGSKIYYLSYNNWDFNHQIAKGDTLKKEKNTFTIRLIKYSSGEILVFN